jgi:type IV secretion system protein VirB9
VKRELLGALLVLYCAQAWAEAADPRVRDVAYADGQVIALEIALGQHLHVELPPGERFVNLAAGDTAAFEAGADGRHLMIKPTRLAGPMSLTLVTSARAWQFEYRAVRVSARPLQWLRLHVPAVAPARPAVVLNFDYLYCGDHALQPVAASDDGLQTRLTFAASAELPAVFVASADGEALVNTHVEGTSVVVQRLAERLVLRRGSQVGCVVNRAYAERGRVPPGHSAVPTRVRTDVEGDS